MGNLWTFVVESGVKVLRRGGPSGLPAAAEPEGSALRFDPCFHDSCPDELNAMLDGGMSVDVFAASAVS
jgi:hypothetical protein